MRAREKGIAGALLGLIAAAFGACLLPEIGIAEKEPPDDAGSDAPVGCIHADYPSPPNKGDGTSIPDFVVAVHQIDMGDLSDEPPGLDLDNTCTCFEDAGDTCSTKLSTPRCDGTGGIDNAASTLFKLITDNLGSGSFGSDYYSQSADLGGWSLLFQISNFNGTPDDPDVSVALFVSPGFVSPATPNWDGKDEWPISDDTLGPSGLVTEPLYVSNGAYVTGGVLVATMPTAEIRFSGSDSTIRAKFVGGVLSGDLILDEPTGIRLENGIFAARWAEKDVFATLSSFRGQGGLKLCNSGGNFVYGIVKTKVCSARDILVDPVQPSSAPCDALSIGIGFKADPALLGAVVPAAMQTPGCDPGTDPIDDSCN